MPTFRKIERLIEHPIDDIRVGQVYECTQKRHKGWRVEVVHIGTNHVQAKAMKGNQSNKAKAHSKNGNFNYKIEQFRRDYELITDATPEVFDRAPEPFTEPIIDGTHDLLTQKLKTCTRCGKQKPQDSYQKKRNGVTANICKQCIIEARAAGIALKRAAPQNVLPSPTALESPPVHGATPTMRPDIDAIAIQLLDLAKQVEQLGTPPELVTLATTVRDVLLEAELSHGVYILPAATFDKLQEAFNSVKGRIQWPQ